MGKYRKTIVAAIGAAVTWAITNFPDNHDVQLFGGLISAIITAVGVFQVTNDPAPVSD